MRTWMIIELWKGIGMMNQLGSRNLDMKVDMTPLAGQMQGDPQINTNHHRRRQEMII